MDQATLKRLWELLNQAGESRENLCRTDGENFWQLFDTIDGGIEEQAAWLHQFDK